MRAIPFLIALVLFAFEAPARAAESLKPWSGGPVPRLELKDLGGRAHRLPDYRGQVVLVNFWATWCAPCREEMPSIGLLSHKLAGRPFVVLAVNVDEPESRVRRFLDGMPLGFPVLMDAGGRATKEWKVRILPASFVLGRDGSIRYTVTGELDWASERVLAAISELLPDRGSRGLAVPDKGARR